MYLNVDRQVCVIKTVAYRVNTDTQTHRHTDTWTDKTLKTEGPRILSNDIFFFKKVIIGGPTDIKKSHICPNLEFALPFLVTVSRLSN